MKVIYLIMCLFLFLNPVLAEEDSNLNLEESITIKYKWYKLERVEGTYYKKGEELAGYLEDEENTIYGDYSSWNTNNCSYSNKFYDIENRFTYAYRRPILTRYIRFTNFKDLKNIRAFSDSQELTYDILKSTSEELIIDLKKAYDTSTVWLFVDANNSFDISFHYNTNFTYLAAYKHLEKGGLLKPDETWLGKNITYDKEYLYIRKSDTPFLTLDSIRLDCRIREIKTYRYKLKKVYYDDNYHSFVEGYFPESTDYLIEYTGEIPEREVEVIKTVTDKVIEKEYVYSEEVKDDLKEKDTEFENEPPIKTKYIENNIIKKIYKIPKKVYLIIAILLIISIIEFFVIKKKSNKLFD